MSVVPLEFYVYLLSDPRDGLPFYAGKGSGRRAWAHEAAVRRGNMKGNAAKSARIKSILDVGMRVHVAIVCEYELESDAFEHEIEMISTTAGLLNVLPGGEGSCLSPEEAAKRSAARAARIMEKRRLAALYKPGNDAARSRDRLTGSIIRTGAANNPEILLWLIASGSRMKPQKQSAKRSNAELAAFRASKPGATEQEKKWAARTACHLQDDAPKPLRPSERIREQIATDVELAVSRLALARR